MSDYSGKMTGAVKTPRWKLARAKWVGELIGDVTAPDNYAILCPDYDIAGNDQHGDCVSAEESNSKRAYSIAVGIPEIEIPGANVVAWARKWGFLNGADLSEVMDQMAKAGMIDTASKEHRDAKYLAVDFTNKDEVKKALYQYKTLKIAVAAGQLQSASTSSNGWWLVNARRDQRIDHCVALHGYGTAQYLAYLCGVKVPSKVDPNTFCVLLYTWGTVGILDWDSMVNITSEAWARDPGDVTNPPTPVPTPVPDPTPVPGPTPIPKPPTPDPIPVPTPTPVPFDWALLLNLILALLKQLLKDQK